MLAALRGGRRCGLSSHTRDNNEPYRYAKPMLMAKKFVTPKRPTEAKASKARSKGPSARALALQGLDAVYAYAGLPSVTVPDQLPEGEQQMLKKNKLDNFVSELYSPSQASKRPRQGTSTKPTR